MTRLLAALLALVGLALPGTPAAAQSIKLGTLAPQGSPWHAIIRDMTDAWTKGTGGKLKVRIYPGGVAGDEPDMVRKMRVGQLHAASLTGVGLSTIAPEIGALQLPMLIRDYEELDHVMEKVGPRLEAILEQKGFKVLNWGDAGWVHFFAQKPVVRPDDLKPLKLFVWAGDTAYVEAFKDAGYRPVPLAATEIHSGLASGLINAFATTPLAALSFQWFGQAKHMNGLRWAPLVGATIITMDAWKRIPDAQKPVVLKAAQDAGARMRADTRRLGDRAIEVMKRHGLVVHDVPPAAVAQWERASRAAYPKLVGRAVPADMVAEIEKHLAEFRARKAGHK
jgi:TRAP-type transport system periplasmic protein